MASRLVFREQQLHNAAHDLNCQITVRTCPKLMVIFASVALAVGAPAAPPAKPAETPAEQLIAAASLGSTNINAALRIYDNIIQRSRTSPEAQEAMYRKGIMLRALKR